MDTIKFECSHCGNVLMAGADQGGIEAKCPKCGKLVQVPAFVVSVSAAPPRREEPVPAAPTPPEPAMPAAPAAPARKEEAPPAAPAPMPPPLAPAAPVRPAPAALAPSKPEPTGAEALFAASTPVTFVTDLLLGIVRFIRKAPRCFIGYQKILAAVGAYALLAAGLFFPLQYIVMAIRFKTTQYVFVGLAGVAAALLLHYVAVKFASAGPALVRNNSGRISSRAYLDCCALLALVAAIAAVKPDINILNQDIETVIDKNPSIKKLIIWRHNIIAHTTASNIVNNVNISKKYIITYDDISELLSRATTLLNKYSKLFNASTYSTQAVGYDDYLDVLNAVKFKLDVIKLLTK